MRSPDLSKKIDYIVTCVIPTLIIMYCIVPVLQTGNIYAIAKIPFTHEYVHSYSMSLFAIAFMLYQRLFRQIPIITRIIVSFLVIAIHSYFGGFLWDFNNLIVNKIGNIMLFVDMAVIVWLYFMILLLNKHYPILKKKHTIYDEYKTIILFLTQVVTYFGLWLTGFWTHFAVGGSYGDTDPNANIFWLVMRTTTFFVFYYLFEQSEKDNYDIEPPRF